MSTINLAPGPEVRLASIQHRPEKTLPYIVRWKVAGRWHSKSFERKGLAEDYWARLRLAINEAERFDRDTGLPPQFDTKPSQNTFAIHAETMFKSYYRKSSPRTRRANAQALGVVIPLMVLRTRRGSAPDDIRQQIEMWLAGESDIPLWVQTSSMPLSDITADTCRNAEKDIRMMRVKDASASKAAGTRVEKAISPRDIKRYIGVVNSVLNDAVSTNLLALNPWPKDNNFRTFKVDRAQESEKIDARTLPTMGEVMNFIHALENDNPGSKGNQMIAYCLFYLGLRPSEALALNIENLDLPNKGWGEALIEEAVTDAGGRWTKRTEQVGRTKTGRSRKVPIPPVMVKRLRGWIGNRKSGLLVRTRTGTTVSSTNLARAFRTASQRYSEGRARAGLPPISITPYTLRHVCATLMLNSGVAVGETARRLGHSPKVLLDTYIGILGDDKKTANARLNRVFTV
jgi:integrase